MADPLQIADAYLTHHRQRSADTEWALDLVQDLTLKECWETLWDVVLAVARREAELEVDALAYVAAGPLEDIICKAGPDFIERIEQEAKFNRQFGRMLTGAWLYGAHPAVRDRVVKLCRAFPRPIDEPYRF